MKLKLTHPVWELKDAYLVAIGTFTSVVTDAVDTCGRILTETELAVVDVLGAVASTIARWTGTGVISQAVNTCGAILAGVDGGRAVFYLLITVAAGISLQARTGIGLHMVITAGVVLTEVSHTIIDVGLAPVSFVPQWANAAVKLPCISVRTQGLAGLSNWLFWFTATDTSGPLLAPAPD